MNDLQFAFRQLLKNPGFTTVTVLTLALGIGANTAIFTVINALTLRSLPVRDPEELVQITTRSRSSHVNDVFDYPFYELFRDNTRTLTGLFAATGIGNRDRLIVAADHTGASAEFVRGQVVSGNFFSVLGVPALLGRTLTIADDQPGNPQAALVISQGFWQRRFASDPSIIGRTVIFNDIPFTIVGVTPREFFGIQPGDNPDLWWPMQMMPQVDRDPAGRRLRHGYSTIRLMGRLAPNITRSRAEAELQLVFLRWLKEYAESRSSQWSADQRRSHFSQKLQLRPGHAGYTGLREQFHQPLLILMVIVAVVLMIACANVASLLLARAAARVREFSVRSALGAGRIRLIRQLLVESLLLAGLGGLFGLLLAQGGTRLLLHLMDLKTNLLSFNVAPDSRVLLFTVIVALLTGILFGLAPAFRSSRIDLASALKGSAGTVAGSATRQRLSQALVVTQVALCLVLLIGAGLFVRTLRNLQDMDMGFNRENLVQFSLDFTERLDGVRRTALYKELLARLETLPGVQSASVYNFGLLSGNSWTQRFLAEGQVASPDENLECHGMWAGPRFFETLGMKLISGRDFNAQDELPGGMTNLTAPRIAVINETMARRSFAGVDPLGRRIYSPNNPEKKLEIVGVVKDAKYRSLRQDAPPTIYVPFFQEATSSGAIFALRITGDTRAAMASLQNTVTEIDSAARVRSVKAMNDVVNNSVHRERMVAQLGSFFSLFALALACLGLYGVLSFAVVQRTREIGVRVALGARRRSILSLVIGQGVRLVLIGVLLGIGGALAATRLVSSLLFGVTATDPLTFIGVSFLLVIIAVLASWLPARQATKVDPMIALRYE
jgi:predicted permease